MAAGVNFVILVNILLLTSCVPNKGEPRFSSNRGSHHSSHSQHVPKVSYQPQYHSSGRQAHSYPTSGSNSRLSGFGNSHSYPPPGSTSRLSGSGSSGYPMNTALRYPQTAQNPVAPRPNVHSYPPRNGLSGNGYPNTGYRNQHPGRMPNGYTHQNLYAGNNYNPNTHVHHHYHYDYRPPRTIRYGGRHMNYPVYRGALPTYVNKYRSSANKFKYLLAGLALFNLALVASNLRSRHYHDHYRPQRNERCSFGVSYPNGNYEEMGIDCRTITNFIFSEESKSNHYQPEPKVLNTQTVISNTTRIESNPPTVDATNPLGQVHTDQSVPHINSSPNEYSSNNPSGNMGRDMTQSSPSNYPSAYPSGPEPKDYDYNNSDKSVKPYVEQTKFGNEASIDYNTNPNVGVADTVSRPSRSVTSSSVTSTTSEVVDAMDPRFHGDPISVTPEMKCYVTRRTSMSYMKKEVPCGLLHTYTAQSFVRSFGMRVGPSMKVLLLVAVLLIW